MSSDVTAFDPTSTFVHLKDGGAAETLGVGAEFWRDVMAGTVPLDRLLGVMDVTEDTPHWERHPKGEELLCVTSGRLEVVLEAPSGERVVALLAGRAVLVPRGVWHRLVVHAPARLLFVTPGDGTEHRAVVR